MPTLDNLIKSASELSSVVVQRDAVERELEEAKQRLQDVRQETDRKARDLIAQATQEARQVLEDASAQKKALDQREADLATRESAVAWVDAKIEILRVKELALEDATQAAETARVDAKAAQDYWTTRLNELTAKDEALTLREHALDNAQPSP